MTLHLIKLSVGSRSVESIHRWQQERKFRHASGKPAGIHKTTMRPQREAELLDGGSIYWVVKGHIIARNPLLAFEVDEGRKAGKRVSIVYGLPVVPTVPRPHRAFQGWRYFEPKAAPPDLPYGLKGKKKLPADLAAKLDELGLL
ncbi:MAG TPA: DUF1489 domain-containing protein [Sphingomonadales bacterium]|nr:DUF1489 domain-containing protein [Sphingomonadales bacterium]